jgi:hypothetical protein
MRNPAVATDPRATPWRPGRARSDEFDGWLGTPAFPGYRAGRIVARLTHLPHQAAGQLTLDVLLLDEAGRTSEATSGACACLGPDSPAEDRARLVCMGAELVRHAGNEPGRFGAITAAVAMLREQGAGRAVLMSAARLLDLACSETTLVHSLADMLERCLGDDDARDTVANVLARLQRNHVIAATMTIPPCADLTDLLHLLVQGLGKHRARHVLRMATDFDLVPALEMVRG